MPAYHSAIPAEGKKFIGNVPVLPLRITAKGTGRGPAPPTITANEEDVVDESLNLFKANILFTSFEVTLTRYRTLFFHHICSFLQIREKSDLVLVYCILYISLCLKQLAKAPNKEKGRQDMFSLALQNFALPGDADFPLNAFFEKPK